MLTSSGGDGHPVLGMDGVNAHEAQVRVSRGLPGWRQSRPHWLVIPLVPPSTDYIHLLLHGTGVGNGVAVGQHGQLQVIRNAFAN